MHFCVPRVRPNRPAARLPVGGWARFQGGELHSVVGEVGPLKRWDTAPASDPVAGARVGNARHATLRFLTGAVRRYGLATGGDPPG
jgi:hypothetical protein